MPVWTKIPRSLFLVNVSRAANVRSSRTFIMVAHDAPVRVPPTRSIIRRDQRARAFCRGRYNSRSLSPRPSNDGRDSLALTFYSPDLPQSCTIAGVQPREGFSSSFKRTPDRSHSTSPTSRTSTITRPKSRALFTRVLTRSRPSRSSSSTGKCVSTEENTAAGRPLLERTRISLQFSLYTSGFTWVSLAASRAYIASACSLEITAPANPMEILLDDTVDGRRDTSLEGRLERESSMSEKGRRERERESEREANAG